MNRTAWMATILTSAALAGCIGGTDEATMEPAGGAAPAPDVPALPAVLHFTSCTEHLAVLPIPTAMLDFLPDGFSPAPFPGEPTGQVGMYFILSYSCTADAVPANEMVIALAVSAPEEYQAEGVEFYVIPVAVATDSEAHAELYSSWGWTDVELGTVLTEVMADTPVARLGHALADLDGMAVHVYTQAQEDGTEEPGKVRVFGFGDLFGSPELVGITEFSWTEGQMRTGVAHVRADCVGCVPPVMPFITHDPGIGIEIWGEEYGYHLAFTDLRASASDAATA